MSDPVTNSHGLVERLERRAQNTHSEGRALLTEAIEHIERLEAEARALRYPVHEAIGYLSTQGSGGRSIERALRAALPESPRAERSE